MCYLNLATPTPWRLNCLLFLLFIGIDFGNKGRGQDDQFKKDLFNKGVQQLQTGDEIDQFELNNAFECALMIGQEPLAEQIIDQFKISRSDAFHLAVNQAPHLSTSRLAFKFLPRKKFNWRDSENIAKLAFRMGKQREDFRKLSNSIQDFLVSPILDEERSDRGWEKEAVENIRRRRSDFLKFSYRLGRLENKTTLEPVEEFHDGISDKKLKELLDLFWICKIGFRVMNGEELLQTITDVKSKDFALRSLCESFRQIPSSELAAGIADRAIETAVKLYFDPERDSFEFEDAVLLLEESYLEFQLPEFQFFLDSFSRSSPEQIIKIAENSNVYRSELDILKLISKEIKNRPIKPKLLKNWGLALVKSCLISKRPNDAKAIASRLSIEIPFNDLVEYCIQQANFELAVKEAESSLPNNKIQKVNILASALLMAHRDEQAQPYIVQLENHLLNQQRQVPAGKQANWLVEQVLLCGWGTKNQKFPRLPLEKKILELFIDLKGDPEISKVIARSLDSFTPPSLSSSQTLLKMMKMLPRADRITTKFEIVQLADKIKEAAVTHDKKLRSQAVELIERTHLSKLEKNEHTSRLAFAFATAGDEQGVETLLQLLPPDPKVKAWAFIQCAKAFPPRSDGSEDYRFSPQPVGGFF